MIPFISNNGLSSTSSSQAISKDIAQLRKVFDGYQDVWYIDSEFFNKKEVYYIHELAIYDWRGAAIIDTKIAIPGGFDIPADALTPDEVVASLIKVFYLLFYNEQ